MNIINVQWLVALQKHSELLGAADPLKSAVKNSDIFSIARTTRAIIRSFKFFFSFLTDFSRFSSDSISICLKKLISYGFQLKNWKWEMLSSLWWKKSIALIWKSFIYTYLTLWFRFPLYSYTDFQGDGWSLGGWRLGRWQLSGHGSLQKL